MKGNEAEVNFPAEIKTYISIADNEFLKSKLKKLVALNIGDFSILRKLERNAPCVISCVIVPMQVCSTLACIS